MTRAVLDDLDPSLEDLIAQKVEQALAKLARPDAGEWLLTIVEASRRLGESETSTRRRIADGSLPHVLVPGRVAGSFEKRVRQADLDAFIRALAGNRRATSTQRGRNTVTDSKRKSTRTPTSFDQLVEARLRRSGKASTITSPLTTTAQERA